MDRSGLIHGLHSRSSFTHAGHGCTHGADCLSRATHTAVFPHGFFNGRHLWLVSRRLVRHLPLGFNTAARMLRTNSREVMPIRFLSPRCRTNTSRVQSMTSFVL